MLWFTFLLSVASCNSNNKPWTPPPPELEEFEHSYDVNIYRESTATASVSFTHKEYDEITHKLSEGFEVYFDDHALEYEGEGIMGHYIINLKPEEVLGTHHWRIEYNGRGVIEFPVTSERLKLTNEMPNTLTGKHALQLTFDGVADGDIISLFCDNGVNSFFDVDYTVKNKSVIIPTADILSLKNQRTKLSISSQKITKILYK